MFPAGSFLDNIPFAIVNSEELVYFVIFVVLTYSVASRETIIPGAANRNISDLSTDSYRPPHQELLRATEHISCSSKTREHYGPAVGAAFQLVPDYPIDSPFFSPLSFSLVLVCSNQFKR